MVASDAFLGDLGVRIASLLLPVGLGVAGENEGEADEGVALEVATSPPSEMERRLFLFNLRGRPPRLERAMGGLFFSCREREILYPTRWVTRWRLFVLLLEPLFSSFSSSPLESR